MRVAFVGVKRKYQEIEPEYRNFFDQYHLELPFYFARDGKNDVTITTVDDEQPFPTVFQEGGTLCRTLEEKFRVESRKYDVVVHWRKWFPELYRPEAINVINCQDHSFSQEWKSTVIHESLETNRLYGILCFPKWHKENLLRELRGAFNPDRVIDGLTLGVDTDVYIPSKYKNPYDLLWASDPGRGFQQMLEVFFKLSVFDKKFTLHVCYPDYCQPPAVPVHSQIINHGCVQNGPKLCDLFSKCGVLAYPSTFKEPSSRAHRQAMAAGSLVLYPPDMGTPSELIVSGENGIVQPIEKWHLTIFSSIVEGWWKDVGEAARRYAISENWAVQAQRFNGYFEKLVEEKR